MEKDTSVLLKELRGSPVFNSLSDSELGQLSKVIWQRKVEKDELLFELEERPQYLFYILDGELELTLVDDNIVSMKNGDFLGEIGLLHGEFRTGIVRAKKDTQLIVICGTRLFEEKYVAPAISLKIVRVLARRIVGFLQNREQSSTLSLIQKGESDHVEFKSTLRLNMHTDEFDKRIELACLKTIAAFLNTEGGTLLIGVDDAGGLSGLELDRFKNDDKRKLHLTSLVKTSMGELRNRYINIHQAQIDGKDVLRVDCRPALSPVYQRATGCNMADSLKANPKRHNYY